MSGAIALLAAFLAFITPMSIPLLREAADGRFISMPTARTQLAQIFQKTNTSQQSQLVSLLLRLLPVR